MGGLQITVQNQVKTNFFSALNYWTVCRCGGRFFKQTISKMKSSKKTTVKIRLNQSEAADLKTALSKVTESRIGFQKEFGMNDSEIKVLKSLAETLGED